jgi:hypothetical protein
MGQFNVMKNLTKMKFFKDRSPPLVDPDSGRQYPG